MSKKVAQLTKVIYHLNSKNEDHDFDMQDLAEQYEAELEQILKDAAEKVNFFKARLEEASDDKRVQEVARVSACLWLRPALQGQTPPPIPAGTPLGARALDWRGRAAKVSAYQLTLSMSKTKEWLRSACQGRTLVNVLVKPHMEFVTKTDPFELRDAHGCIHFVDLPSSPLPLGTMRMVALLGAERVPSLRQAAGLSQCCPAHRMQVLATCWLCP